MYNLLHRKMKTVNKGTTVDTSNLQPGELVYMDFEFYNVTSIHGFTFIIIVVYKNTRIIGLFPTASTRTPVRIIHFILTTLLNKNTHSKV